MTEATYTIDQFLQGQRALRSSLGEAPERFGKQQMVGMMSDEIDSARAAGKSDQDIAEILHQAGLPITAADISAGYATKEERGK